MKRRRKDGKMDNVILSESRPTSLKKYLVQHVPHEYRNKEQFDFQVSQPLGVEWNGAQAFREMNKAKVLRDVGQAITPIHKGKLPKTKFI